MKKIIKMQKASFIKTKLIISFFGKKRIFGSEKMIFNDELVNELRILYQQDKKRSNANKYVQMIREI